jgi:hypothetical protein
MSGNTTLFADRGFIQINSGEVLYLKSANMKRNNSLQRVDTMSRDYTSAGYRYGNKSIQVALTFEIAADQAQFDTAIADKNADINVTFSVGAERYLLTGVKESDMSLDSSVGDASKAFNYEALNIVNENGDAVNTLISL